MNSLKQIFKQAKKNNATKGMTWKEYQQYAADRGITDAQLRSGNQDARRLANQFFYGTQPVISKIQGAPVQLEAPDIVGPEVPVQLIQQPVTKTTKTTTKKFPKGTTTTIITEEVSKEPKQNKWYEGQDWTSEQTGISTNSGSWHPQVFQNPSTKKSYTPNNRIYLTQGVTTSPAGYSGDGNGPIHDFVANIPGYLKQFEKWIDNKSKNQPLYQQPSYAFNKYQQGGQVQQSSEQDAVMQFVQALAQTLQADPNQVIQAAQQNPDALKSAVQVYQQTQDIQQAAQAFSQALQSQAQAAKHGAKLNYLKALKNQCAEDEELVYFKKGGKVDCGCKKKEDGGEMKKESPISKFKKVKKADDGVKLLSNKQLNDSISKYSKPYKKGTTYEEKVKQEEKLEKFQKEAERRKNSNKSINKDCGGYKLKKGDKVCPKCGKVHAAGAGCMLSSVKKFKMHKQGGSLNGVPFYQKGQVIQVPDYISEEQVEAINNSNKNTAKGLFKGIISGEILPTMPNISRMISSAYKGWFDPKTTVTTGTPPVVALGVSPANVTRLVEETYPTVSTAVKDISMYPLDRVVSYFKNKKGFTGNLEDLMKQLKIENFEFTRLPSGRQIPTIPKSQVPEEIIDYYKPIASGSK